MNSILAKSAALLCAVLMAGSLTACGNKTETKSSEASVTTSAQQQTTVDGTAKVQRSDLAAETENDAAGTLMKFTYTAENSVLAITYDGSDAPMELEYELNGDILNVKDSAGNDTIYHRK